MVDTWQDRIGWNITPPQIAPPRSPGQSSVNFPKIRRYLRPSGRRKIALLQRETPAPFPKSCFSTLVPFKNFENSCLNSRIFVNDRGKNKDHPIASGNINEINQSEFEAKRANCVKSGKNVSNVQILLINTRMHHVPLSMSNVSF